MYQTVWVSMDTGDADALAISVICLSALTLIVSYGITLPLHTENIDWRSTASTESTLFFFFVFVFFFFFFFVFFFFSSPKQEKNQKSRKSKMKFKNFSNSDEQVKSKSASDWDTRVIWKAHFFLHNWSLVSPWSRLSRTSLIKWLKRLSELQIKSNSRNQKRRRQNYLFKRRHFVQR